jgi:hypothetical protein
MATDITTKHLTTPMAFNPRFKSGIWNTLYTETDTQGQRIIFLADQNSENAYSMVITYRRVITPVNDEALQLKIKYATMCCLVRVTDEYTEQRWNGD